MAFLGSQNSGTYTPADVERRRRLAEMLAGKDIVSQEPFGALAEGLIGARAGYEGQRANEDEQRGIASANESLSAMLTDPNVSVDKLIGANGAGNPWANSSQQAIIAKLLGKEVDQMYPDTADGGFFGSTLPYENPDGSLGYYQLRKDEAPVLPEGAHWLEPTTIVNTGTNQVAVGRNTANPVNTLAIENEQAAMDTARGKELGTGQGAAITGAPGDIRAGETALGIIDQIRNHPDLQSATGLTAPLNQHLIGTGRFDFQNMVEQAKSGAFLTAIQEMRGLGALSNAEGQTATAAVTRMNTALDQKSFLNALDDYQAIVERGVANAQSKLAGAQGGGQGAGSQPVPVTNNAEYQAVPSGTEYVDPQGNVRVKK